MGIKLRILYLGKFDKPFRTENYVTYALRQLGVDVVTKEAYKIRLLQVQKILSKDSSNTVVLFSKVSPPYFAELIPWCKSRGITTVTWVWDLYWGYRPSRPVQFKADLVFTTDGGHESRWRQHGINHQVLRQGIHAPEHIMLSDRQTIDLAFIGSTNSNRHRRDFTRWLTRTFGTRIKFYNNVRGLELNKLLAKTKIVIGDSYPSPNYWSNRVYEILGRGGFLMFPRVQGLDSEFKPDEHYVPFEHGKYSDIVDLVHYFLKNPKLRLRIQKQGFTRCGDFTYTTRAEKLLAQIRHCRQAGSTETNIET